LVLFVGIRPDGAGGVLHQSPAPTPDQLTDLVVGEETLGTGEFSRRAAPARRSVQTIVGSVCQSEGLTV